MRITRFYTGSMIDPRIHEIIKLIDQDSVEHVPDELWDRELSALVFFEFAGIVKVVINDRPYILIFRNGQYFFLKPDVWNKRIKPRLSVFIQKGWWLFGLSTYKNPCYVISNNRLFYMKDGKYTEIPRERFVSLYRKMKDMELYMRDGNVMFVSTMLSRADALAVAKQHEDAFVMKLGNTAYRVRDGKRLSEEEFRRAVLLEKIRSKIAEIRA